MKKLTVLLAIVMLTSQFVGCGIFRRVRDHFCRGAFCGGSAPAVTTPGIIAPPRTIIAPQPPVVIPQASVGSFNPCVTCSPVCDCESGLAYPVDAGCVECNGGVVGGGTFVGEGSGTRVIEGGSGSRGVTLPGPAN